MTSTKTNPGNFFEDFTFGQVLEHATPRTVTVGDVALYTASTARALPCSPPTPSPRPSAIRASPLDDLLTFHIVFGKTVPDISLNAIANLGYAECRFLKPVYPGDTLAVDLGGDRPARRTPTARPASSTCAPRAATRTARWCSSTCAG